jgi:hypothetical protein
VEESKIGQFAAETVHNPANMIRLDANVHYLITAHYASKPPRLKGKTVREWLKGKSWKQQFEYGIEQILKALEKVGMEKQLYDVKQNRP